MEYKIVSFADSHTFHMDLDIEDGDILIFAGDMTMAGDLDGILEFNEWIGTLPHPIKIVIAGNHDTYLETHKKNGFNGKKMITNAIYLDEELINIHGINIYGSPYTPSFANMRKGLSFYKERGIELKELWDEIPKETDILLTHGPPYGILDQAYDGSPKGFSVGDKMLLKRVMEIKPKYHIYGHIHEANGIFETGKSQPYGGCTFINASVVDGNYNVVNDGRVFYYKV